MARMWRPKRGSILESVLCTLSRFSLRLIDRTTGKAYSADELEAKILAQTSGTPLVLSAPPENGVLSAIEPLNTLTEAGSATTCTTLHDVGIIGGKTWWRPAGFVGDDGWQVAWYGNRFFCTYGDGTLQYMAQSVPEDVPTPDLATWNAPTIGTGTPDFSLTSATEGTPAERLGQDAIVNEEVFHKCVRLSPVKWVGPFPA